MAYYALLNFVAALVAALVVAFGVATVCVGVLRRRKQSLPGRRKT